MINTSDILQTVRMIAEEKLDIRTITMGISLRNCADPDPAAACRKIRDKITSCAERLVPVAETIERELAEWRRDLEERERALAPEKTIADLAWAGGQEDSVLDENGNVTKKTKEPYLAENDRSLPRASRSLAKAEREMREELSAQTEATRDSLVASLEKLYIAAIKEDRVTDADFYRRSIRSLSPTWKLGVDAVQPEEGGPAEGK